MYINGNLYKILIVCVITITMLHKYARLHAKEKGSIDNAIDTNMLQLRNCDAGTAALIRLKVDLSRSIINQLLWKEIDKNFAIH